mgnify:FL=1
MSWSGSQSQAEPSCFEPGPIRSSPTLPTLPNIHPNPRSQTQFVFLYLLHTCTNTDPLTLLFFLRRLLLRCGSCSIHCAPMATYQYTTTVDFPITQQERSTLPLPLSIVLDLIRTFALLSSLLGMLPPTCKTSQ